MRLFKRTPRPWPAPLGRPGRAPLLRRRQAVKRWLDGWRAAFAAWVMPPGYALWTWDGPGEYGDVPVVEKEPRDA